uniref:Uncharacterized protein n=1 Tax=Brassica oleracea TaxID=3712 RepID=A0A3P6E5N6_BRAOL|nr:unnamed protein product [Brassica oleracea]
MAWPVQKNPPWPWFGSKVRIPYFLIDLWRSDFGILLVVNYHELSW